jgi:hypothetical protein
MKSKFLPVVATVFAAALCGPALAHGDEDHTRDQRPAASAQPVPGGPLIEAVSARRLPDGSLFVPKAVQRQLGLRHVIVTVGELAATVEFNGTVVADPNAGGRVQASQAGRVEAAAGGLPNLGQKVTRGQVLALLRPVVSSIERANQRAQLDEVDAQLAIAERRRERYEQLEGSIARAAIEAARLDAHGLKLRRDALAAGLGAAEPLRAPVSGVISAAHVVAGQVVDARQTVYEVVDPARLAVEALAYDAALVEGIAGAQAPAPGGMVELQFLGGGRQLREQALPLLFRVKSTTAALAVGQPLKVLAQTSRTVKGAAVPLSAQVKVGAGETAVWVRDGAERFIQRRVKVAPLDAARVAVVHGLADGERVVTAGAGLLAQVR